MNGLMLLVGSDVRRCLSGGSHENSQQAHWLELYTRDQAMAKSRASMGIHMCTSKGRGPVWRSFRTISVPSHVWTVQVANANLGTKSQLAGGEHGMPGFEKVLPQQQAAVYCTQSVWDVHQFAAGVQGSS